MKRQERTQIRNERLVAEIDKLMKEMPGKFFAKLEVACNMLEQKYFISSNRIRIIYMNKIKKHD